MADSLTIFTTISVDRPNFGRVPDAVLERLLRALLLLQCRLPPTPPQTDARLREEGSRRVLQLVQQYHRVAGTTGEGWDAWDLICTVLRFSGPATMPAPGMSALGTAPATREEAAARMEGG